MKHFPPELTVTFLSKKYLSARLIPRAISVRNKVFALESITAIGKIVGFRQCTLLTTQFFEAAKRHLEYYTSNSVED